MWLGEQFVNCQLLAVYFVVFVTPFSFIETARDKVAIFLRAQLPAECNSLSQSYCCTTNRCHHIHHICLSEVWLVVHFSPLIVSMVIVLSNHLIDWWSQMGHNFHLKGRREELVLLKKYRDEVCVCSCMWIKSQAKACKYLTTLFYCRSFTVYGLKIVEWRTDELINLYFCEPDYLWQQLLYGFFDF